MQTQHHILIITFSPVSSFMSYWQLFKLHRCTANKRNTWHKITKKILFHSENKNKRIILLYSSLHILINKVLSDSLFIAYNSWVHWMPTNNYYCILFQYNSLWIVHPCKNIIIHNLCHVSSLTCLQYVTPSIYLCYSVILFTNSLHFMFTDNRC